MYPFKLSSTVHLSLEIDGNPLHNLTKHAFRVCVHVINETHLNLHVFLLGTMLLQPLTGFNLFAFIPRNQLSLGRSPSPALSHFYKCLLQ